MPAAPSLLTVPTAMPRAPFVSHALLLVLHGESAVSALTKRSVTSANTSSPCPAIDHLAAAGISTDLVHPPSSGAGVPSSPVENIEAALRGILSKDVCGSAVSAAEAERSISACETVTLSSISRHLESGLPLSRFGQSTPAAFTVVDAGDDVGGANSLVEKLLPEALRLGEIDGRNEAPKLDINDADDLTSLISPLLIGVMCVGRGWAAGAGKGSLAAPGDRPGVFKPLQSCVAGRADSKTFALDSERVGGQMSVVGSVAWAGSGATRVDDVHVFNGQVRGGDGQLLLSQMLTEVLTKVGLVPKFGA